MQNKKYKWVIIGAGPSGIAVVCKLLGSGVNPHELLWIDPYFKVGDLGRYWSNVSSNTKVRLFIDFLNSIKIGNDFIWPVFQFLTLTKKQLVN